MATETVQVRLCIDCDRRPLPKRGTSERCHLCQQRYNDHCKQEVREEAERKNSRKWGDPLKMCRYTRFYLWKEHLVGYTSGIYPDKPARFGPAGFFYLRTQPPGEDLAGLGNKLVDMNTYQPDFTGDWVKRFKAMIKAAKCIEGEALTWDGSL